MLRFYTDLPFTSLFNYRIYYQYWFYLIEALELIGAITDGEWVTQLAHLNVRHGNYMQ